jgi:hypothetical protein
MVQEPHSPPPVRNRSVFGPAQRPARKKDAQIDAEIAQAEPVPGGTEPITREEEPPSAPPPFRIAIDDIEYPCERWQTQSSARTLERRYDSGFNGGMGFFTEKQITAPNQIYNCVNLDPSTFPYLRMRKGARVAAITLSTGADADKPAYGFVMDGPASREYLYIVNADRIYKIDLGASGIGTPAQETGSTQIASGVAGRPAYFEGKWYVPFGDAGGAFVERLDTVGADAITNDSWNTMDFLALHLTKMMNEGVAQMWRAHTTNKVDASATAVDAASFAGDFEVGDTSFAITDMLSVTGELFISKPDRPWRFDSQGNSIPVIEFVGATGGYLTNYQGLDGSNSGAFGPYAYWAHSTGLWRVWGDSAVTIGPDAPANWTPINLDGLTPSPLGWFGFAAWGRWAYAVNSNTGLHIGWVESDGTIKWMGNLISPQETSWSAKLRIGITTTSTNPILWMLDDSRRFAVFDLELDGSIRQIRTDGAGSTYRGGDNEKGQIWMPGTDFGEPEKQKRIRMMWLDIDNNEYANLEIRARMHRDRNVTSVQLGSDLRSSAGSGHFEFTPNTAKVDIASSSVANPTVITTTTAHSFQSGDIVIITGHNSSVAPDINGEHVVTWISATTFSIPVNVTVGGSSGTVESQVDTAYEVMAALEFDTNQASAFSPATADPRIRAFGIRAVTPHTYKATIPVTPDGMTGNLGVKDALIKLRALKNGEGVPVREPGFNFTFTGYITDVREVVISAEHGEIKYAVEVAIDRWVL